MNEGLRNLQETLQWVKDRQRDRKVEEIATGTIASMAVILERERCAQIAESMDTYVWNNEDIAARIRGTS